MSAEQGFVQNLNQARIQTPEKKGGGRGLCLRGALWRLNAMSAVRGRLLPSARVTAAPWVTFWEDKQSSCYHSVDELCPAADGRRGNIWRGSPPRHTCWICDAVKMLSLWTMTAAHKKSSLSLRPSDAVESCMEMEYLWSNYDFQGQELTFMINLKANTDEEHLKCCEQFFLLTSKLGCWGVSCHLINLLKAK